MMLAAIALTACAGSSPVADDFVHDHAAMMARHAPPPSSDAAAPAPKATTAIAVEHLTDLERILPALADRRVIYVGETHDQYAHHLVQLEVIRYLHQADPRLAIGLEFFQQPFQEALDRYVAGEIDERTMLRQTEYYERWSYDYRLYAPILQYAREHRLPLLALNASSELVGKVRKSGLEGLDDEDRALLPAEIDRSDLAHERRMQTLLEAHPHGSGNVDRFLEVQLLWDEAMAERAAAFLDRHPGHRLVVLAGSGHLAYGSGIPDRVNRRVPVTSAILLNDWQREIAPGLADYLLMPEEQNLPPAGMIGARLDTDEAGLKIVSCTPGSACEEVGLQAGDRLLAIEGVPIAGMADLREQMWDRRPGDEVGITVSRERRFSRNEALEYRVRLR